MNERKTWRLVIELLAEDESDARGKFADDVPFLLLNHYTEEGNTRIISLTEESVPPQTKGSRT